MFKSLSFNPEISFDADYTIDGRLLLLPIRGNGKANITMCEFIINYFFEIILNFYFSNLNKFSRDEMFFFFFS